MVYSSFVSPCGDGGAVAGGDGDDFLMFMKARIIKKIKNKTIKRHFSRLISRKSKKTFKNKLENAPQFLKNLINS